MTRTFPLHLPNHTLHPQTSRNTSNLHILSYYDTHLIHITRCTHPPTVSHASNFRESVESNKGQAKNKRHLGYCVHALTGSALHRKKDVLIFSSTVFTSFKAPYGWFIFLARQWHDLARWSIAFDTRTRASSLYTRIRVYIRKSNFEHFLYIHEGGKSIYVCVCAALDAEARLNCVYIQRIFTATRVQDTFAGLNGSVMRGCF